MLGELVKKVQELHAGCRVVRLDIDNPLVGNCMAVVLVRGEIMGYGAVDETAAANSFPGAEDETNLTEMVRVKLACPHEIPDEDDPMRSWRDPGLKKFAHRAAQALGIDLGADCRRVNE